MLVIRNLRAIRVDPTQQQATKYASMETDSTVAIICFGPASDIDWLSFISCWRTSRGFSKTP